jgi:small subunit ribosomal protein S20
MRNRKAKSTAKSVVKDLDAALKAGNKEEAASKMKAMTKVLDTTAGKGILNKKAAARKKSRMQLKVNKLLAR